ncbi:pyrroloquinoline quinone precursor peptide PqqA [Denitromonas halophila]|nr:pyrroloquinoline quinone precursor peptide PqqA [Denitromonas halophila]
MLGSRGAKLPRHAYNLRRHIMKWETPTAADFRFGFEITMYIATR